MCCFQPPVSSLFLLTAVTASFAFSVFGLSLQSSNSVSISEVAHFSHQSVVISHTSVSFNHRHQYLVATLIQWFQGSFSPSLSLWKTLCSVPSPRRLSLSGETRLGGPTELHLKSLKPHVSAILTFSWTAAECLASFWLCFNFNVRLPREASPRCQKGNTARKVNTAQIWTHATSVSGGYGRSGIFCLPWKIAAFWMMRRLRWALTTCSPDSMLLRAATWYRSSIFLEQQVGPLVWQTCRSAPGSEPAETGWAEGRSCRATLCFNF